MLVYVVMETAINFRKGAAEVVTDIVEVTTSERRAAELCERVEHRSYWTREVKEYKCSETCKYKDECPHNKGIHYNTWGEGITCRESEDNKDIMPFMK